MYEIRDAGPADCSMIQKIASDTWPEAYGSIISAEQIHFMLDLFYAEESLIRQMENDHHRFILISGSGTALGFASYSPKKDAETGLFRLHKLYVLPTCQGKGLGKILIDHILEDIKMQKGHAIELNVNRHNKARLFYERLGFTIMYEEDIDIGNGYWMNDYVMKRKL